MTSEPPARDAARATAHSATRAKGTRALLVCGVVAGPLFVGVAVVQILTREGFDLTRLAISSLSLGDLGWIQITNFVVAGLLSVSVAIGLRRALHGVRAGTWGPPLVGLFGISLIAAGIFTTDPALGFPPGSPNELPTTFSWHAQVHNIVSPLAFAALTAACFVFARRFAGLKRWGWVAYSVLTGLLIPLLSLWPSYGGAGVRLFAATVLAFGWLTATAARVSSES